MGHPSQWALLLEVGEGGRRMGRRGGEGEEGGEEGEGGWGREEEGGARKEEVGRGGGERRGESMVCMYVALFSHCHLHEALCWLQYSANARKHVCYVNTGYVTLSLWLCHTVTRALSHCHTGYVTLSLAMSHYHSGYVTLSLWLRHTVTLATSHCHSGYVTLSYWLHHTGYINIMYHTCIPTQTLQLPVQVSSVEMSCWL